MKKVSRIFLMLGLSIAVHSPALFAQNASKASVNVYEKAKDGGIEYSFEIVNTDANPISQFSFGLKLDPLGGELVEFPKGWSTKKPTAGVGSPKDWNATVVLQEDSKFYALNWEAAAPLRKLKSGEKLGGFSVTLPKADKTLLSASFNLYPANSPPISGKLNVVAGSPNSAKAHDTETDAQAKLNETKFKDCDAVKHGKTTSRTRYKLASAPSTAACAAQKEIQTGACNNGTVTFNGTATFESCKVSAGKSK